MKMIFKIPIILFVLFISKINAQNTPEPGDNILNPALDKFVGTWKWEGNGKSLVIILKKINAKVPVNMDLYADMLFGYHEYKENGNIIESSMSFINSTFNQKKYTLISFGKKDNANEIRLGVAHISKNKGVDGLVEYIDPNHIKLISLKNYQMIRINQPPFDSTINLPQNIILTKQ